MFRSKMVVAAAILVAGVLTVASAQRMTAPRSRDRERNQQAQTQETATAQNATAEIESVEIGDLHWMKRNLNVETQNSWCYDDSPANCERYGRLYTWQAAIDACASLDGGWRLPTSEEWETLISWVGGETNAGSKLKAKSGWADNDNGTDDFDFSALPGGERMSSFMGVAFRDIGENGNWWSATANQSDATFAWGRFMCSGSACSNRTGAGTQHSPKTFGYSVRCIRN